IQAAKDLGAQLFEAAGLRDVASANVAETTRIRQQAYSLLSRAYTETRRCIQYLRFHEGDAESIAPSFFTGRSRSAAVEPTPAPDPPARAPSPPAPSPTPAPEPPAVTAAQDGTTPPRPIDAPPSPTDIATADEASTVET